MPAEDASAVGLEAPAQESIERVARVVQEELGRLALARSTGELPPSDASTDAFALLPAQQLSLLAELVKRVAASYRDAVHVIVLRPDSILVGSAGAHASSGAKGSAGGDHTSGGGGAGDAGDATRALDARGPGTTTPPPRHDAPSASLLHMEPVSTGSNSSTLSQHDQMATATDLVVHAPHQQHHSPSDGGMGSTLSAAVLAATNSGGLAGSRLDLAPQDAAGASQRLSDNTQRTSASSGWGSQYLIGASNSSLLAGMSGLTLTQPTPGTAPDLQPHQQQQQQQQARHSGPLSQLPGSSSTLALGGGSVSSAPSGPLPSTSDNSSSSAATLPNASGILGGGATGSNANSNASMGRFVSSSATHHASPTFLRSVHAALSSGSLTSTGVNAAAAASRGGPGAGTGTLQQQQVAPGSGGSMGGVVLGGPSQDEQLLAQQQQQQQMGGGLGAGDLQVTGPASGGSGVSGALLRAQGLTGSGSGGVSAAGAGGGGVHLVGLPPRGGASGLVQQQAEAEEMLLRRLQQQQQQQQQSRMPMPSGGSSSGGLVLLQPHQQQQQNQQQSSSLLHQLLHQQQNQQHQHMQMPGSAEQNQQQQQMQQHPQLLQLQPDGQMDLPGSGSNAALFAAQQAHSQQLHQQQQQQQHSQQLQQAFTYQVDPSTGNLVAVMSQDMYAAAAQQQAQQQALVLDGTLVLESAGPPDHMGPGQAQQQYMSDSSAFSSLFADPNSTGAMPLYMTANGSSAQQQQQHQQQQQQQQLNALLAAQQQQQQQLQLPTASNSGYGSFAALHAGGSTANSEPLPMLVSIPTAQGGMTLALATPGGGNPHQHSHQLQALQGGGGDGSLQLAAHGGQLTLGPGGGLTLTQAGGQLGGSTLLQHRHMSTPPSPLPGTGTTLLSMPGGPLLHGLQTHQLSTLGGMSGGLPTISLSNGMAAAQPLPASTAEMPGRFKVLPLAVQQRILTLCRANLVITIRDFDDKVVSKLSLLVDSWGVEQALAMLDHLEYRMRTKQGAMKNGPGYLDVAVCSHLDMLKAQGACPKTMKLDEYAQQVLVSAVFHELCEAVNNNRWLAWEHFDQGIIQLLKRIPPDSAVEKLQEITYHSFKNVDNVKGCIMSILNSKIREDRRRP